MTAHEIQMMAWQGNRVVAATRAEFQIQVVDRIALTLYQGFERAMLRKRVRELLGLPPSGDEYVSPFDIG